MKSGSIALVLGLRMAAAALLAYLFIWIAGEALARAFLPVIRQAYELLDQDHRVLEFVISRQTALGNSDWVYRLKVAADSVVMVGTHALATDPRGWTQVSVLVSFLWHPLLMAAVTMAAFDACRWPVWAYRVLCLLPLLALVSLLDIPWILWAEVWEGYVPLLAEDAVSPLLMWSGFLQRGGRFLLGALAGLLAVRLADTFAAGAYFGGA